MNGFRSMALAFIAVAVLDACAAKRLPPGTPPPEYETRELPPWSDAAPDAGAEAPPRVEPERVPEDAAVPSEEPKIESAPVDAGLGPSPDAGVR
jgi:hypothetical protein